MKLMEFLKTGSTVARVALLVACVALLVALASCGVNSPCSRLAPPTAAQIQAAQSGAEVEIEVGSTECVVDPVTKTWVIDN